MNIKILSSQLHGVDAYMKKNSMSSFCTKSNSVAGVSNHFHYSVCRRIYFVSRRNHSHAVSQNFLRESRVVYFFNSNKLTVGKGG